MTLDELIVALDAADPSLVLPLGFSNPHSYRGDYMDLAAAHRRATRPGHTGEARRARIGMGRHAEGVGMSDDVVRVHLSDDYYEHEQFSTVPQTWWSKDDLYDVPREQVERWEVASAAWAEAQAEMAKLMDERREQRQAQQAAQRQREDARLAEIRAGLYGGRKTT